MTRKDINKPKVAVIGLKGLPAFGGAATVGENIINYLKEDYKIDVYSVSSHTSCKTGIYNGINQIVFKSIPFKKLNTLLYYLKATFYILFFKKYDLIHLHHRDAAFIIPILKIKAPVVLTTHGVMGRVKKWRRFKWYLDAQLKYFVKYANIVTCVSKIEQKILLDRYGINAIYIPNGINENKVNNTIDIYEYFGIKGDYILFSAGRILELKGLDILLKALHLIKQNICLVVLGDLDQEAEYKLEIIKLSEGLNIRFLGLIKNKGVLYELLRSAKFFVFPSRYEAMSIMLLEAVSQKIPVIASNIESNTDIFDDTEMLFFENENYRDLGEKMEQLLTEYPLSNFRVEKAYNALIDRYLWSKISQDYNCVYKELLVKK